MEDSQKSSRESGRSTHLASQVQQLKALLNEYEEQVDELEDRLRQEEVQEDNPDNPDSADVLDSRAQAKATQDKAEIVKTHLQELVTGNPRDASRGLESSAVERVTVKYFPKLQDGMTEGMECDDYSTAEFRINRDVTFEDLKQTVCRFWSIDEVESMGFRASNHALLDFYEEASICDTLLTQFIKAEFYLYRKNNKASKLLTTDEECCISEDFFAEHRNAKGRKKRANYSNKQFRSDCAQLEEQYPGLKTYKPDAVETIESADDNRLRSRYHSAAAFIVVTLALVATLVILSVRRDVNSDYWVQRNIHSALLTEFDQSKNFFNINSPQSVVLFMTQVIAPSFFKDTTLPGSNLLDKFSLIGPLVIRQVRSKSKDCESAGNFDQADLVCYYHTYSESTRSEETLELEGLAGQEYTSFQTADENKIDYTFPGEFSDYDGSGYVWTLYPSQVSKSEFVDEFLSMYSAGWVDRGTRALFVNANLYSVLYDQVVPLQIVIEATPSGYFYPSSMTATVVQINVYDTESIVDMIATGCEALRLAAAFFFLYLYVRIGLDRQGGEANYAYWWSLRGLLDLALFGLTIATFSLSLMMMVNEAEFFEESEYFDLQGLAYWYVFDAACNALLLLLLLVRFILIFNVLQRVHTFLHTLEIISGELVCLVLIMTPILVGLIVFSHNVWGLHMYEYRSFEWSLLSVLMFTLGQGDFEEAMSIDVAVSMTIMFLYFFVVVFFMSSAFLGIIIDAYRRVRFRSKVLRQRDSHSGCCPAWIKQWFRYSFCCKE